MAADRWDCEPTTREGKMNDPSEIEAGNPPARLSRRDLLRAAGMGFTAAGAAALVGCGDDDKSPATLPDVGSEPPPEVTRIRMPAWDGSSLCLGPLLLATDFLPEEGLTPEWVSYLPSDSWAKLIDDGTFHLAQDFAASTIVGAASAPNLTILAGVHSGCVELFAREGINSPGDLAGKKVAVPFGDTATSPDYAFMLTLMNSIGLPAQRSVASYDADRLPTLLQNGQVDAVLAYPPGAENLRGLKGVRVILSTVDDRPWSSYYCCVLFANSQFARKNPVATKRAMRAVLKGVDLLSREPERAAKRLVELASPLTPGSPLDYDVTLRWVKHLPYGLWRSMNPEDSLRFYALRLREAGEITRTPDEVIKSADWRFLNQLKREVAYAPPLTGNRSAFALDCNIRPVPDLAGPRQG